MKRRILIPLVIVLTLIVGVFAIGVMAADSDPELTITGGNLEFSDRVHILFAVDSENISDTENVRLLVFRGENVKAKNCTLGNEVAVVEPGSPVKVDNVSGDVFTYTEVAAAEMTEDIYVRAYYKDADGNEYYSNVVKYSILQYAMNKLGYTGTPTDNTKLKTMLQNMLIYGASAQDYFGVNTDRLATDEYVKINLEGATMKDGLSYGLIKKGDTFGVDVPTTAEKPYVIWTDTNGKTVAAGDDNPIIARTNRTFVAKTQAVESTFGSYKYVVIVGVDGAGTFYPNITKQADGTYAENQNGTSLTPRIDAIFADGAKTYTNRVTSPTASSISWMSCLHGVLPENHGNTENIQVENGIPYSMDTNYPSILRVAKEAMPDAEIAAIYNWIGITGIVESAADTGITNQRISGEGNLVRYLENGYISENTPALLYIHLNDPDSIGHSYGHHTAEYYAQLEKTDAHIGRIYDAYVNAGIIDETLFIVTSDHGGVKYVNSKGEVSGTHGGLEDCEKYTLFGAAGKNVNSGATIGEMYIRDTASIALHALGIELPDTYTSIIPNNLFPDVVNMVRVEYHDPDLPRYHEPVTTPEYGSGNDVTNYVDNTLAVYMPLDGDTTEHVNNSAVDEYGKITYTDGYFGKGAWLEDGHLNVHASFTPGTDSFTISTWAKFATPTNGLSPMIATKKISSASNGFVFATGRYASVERQDHYGMIEFGTGGKNVRYTGGASCPELAFPTDYIYGWMHVMINVDKDRGLITVYYDFEEAYVIDMPAEVMQASLTSALDYITLGNDTTGAASAKSGVWFDEFMIFNGSFDANDVAGLMEYYGFEGTSAPEENESIGDILDADYYFDFDGLTKNEGSKDTAVYKYGTLEYSEGVDGKAAYLDGADYFTLPDAKFGTGDFTMAAWVKPTDLKFRSGYRIPILSTSTSDSRDKDNYGINVFYDLEYGNIAVIIADGDKGLQEMYRLFKPSTIPGAYKIKNSETGVWEFTDESYANFDAAYAGQPLHSELENQWMHIAVSIDRTAKQATIYLNFKPVMTFDLKYYNPQTFIPDTLSIDDQPLTIGQLGAPQSKYTPKLYLDDLMLFDDALSGVEIAKIEKYYRAPLSDFVDKTPVIDLSFDGSSENTGSYTGTVEEEGTVQYTDGYYGQSVYLYKNAIDLPELKLGKDDLTVAFWVNSEVLTNGGDYSWYGNIFATAYGSESDRAGIAIVFKRDSKGIYVNTNDGNGNRGYAVGKWEGFAEAGEWMHVTVVVRRNPGDGQQSLEIYLNFQKVTLSITGATAFMQNSFDGGEGFTPHIGTDGQGNTSNYTLNAKIDEFLLFNEGLTAEEIAKLAEYYGYNTTQAE